MVGWLSAYCTRTVGVTLTYADTLTRGEGEGGNQSAYCTCTFRVTLTYTDSLTRGGGCEGGNPRTVRVLSELL